MKMILNNKVEINAPDIPEKAREYLKQFWSFPTKEEAESEKNKYYTTGFNDNSQKKDGENSEDYDSEI